MHMHDGFWWGTDLGDFLIEGLKINGAAALTVLCISLFILSVLSEGLKVHRTRSKAKSAREQRNSLNSENTILLNSTNTRPPLLQEAIKVLKDVSLFVFHNILTYGIMLAVMMYNGYVFIAVVLGAFVGYFLFGHISVKTNMENLQAIRTKIICSTRCTASDEPCSSGTTPIISHCPTVVGESSGVMAMQRSNSSSTSETSVINEKSHE